MLHNLMGRKKIGAPVELLLPKKCQSAKRAFEITEEQMS